MKNNKCSREHGKREEKKERCKKRIEAKIRWWRKDQRQQKWYLLLISSIYNNYELVWFTITQKSGFYRKTAFQWNKDNESLQFHVLKPVNVSLSYMTCFVQQEATMEWKLKWVDWLRSTCSCLPGDRRECFISLSLGIRRHMEQSSPKMMQTKQS